MVFLIAHIIYNRFKNKKIKNNADIK